MRKGIKKLWLAVPFFMVKLTLLSGILQISIAVKTAAQAQELKAPERGFISAEPANTWEEGLIGGNGTIGINIFSRPLEETIIFTHERLFLPQGPPVVPPDNSHLLFEIRRLIDRGLYKQATELAFDLSGQESFLYPDTGDKEFLRKHCLPFMEKAALFFEDYRSR